MKTHLFVKTLFFVNLSILIFSCGNSKLDKVHDAYNSILKLEPREQCIDCTTYSDMEGKTRNDFTTTGGTTSGKVRGQSFVRLELDSVEKKANLYTHYGNYIITIDDMVTGGNGKMVEDNYPIEFDNNPFTYDERNDPEENSYGIGFKGKVSAKGTTDYTMNMELDLKDSSMVVRVFNNEAKYTIWGRYYFKDFEKFKKRFDKLVEAVNELKK
jgi:hypothetical protein